MQFRQNTERDINKCADYLRANADDLAQRFAGGCQSWSIEFRADASGPMTMVEVYVESKRADVVAWDMNPEDISEPL